MSGCTDPDSQISDQTSLSAIESGLEMKTVEYVVDNDTVTTKTVNPFVIKRRKVVSAEWAAQENENGDVMAISIPKGMRQYPCVPGRMRAACSVGCIHTTYCVIWSYDVSCYTSRM